MSPRARSGEDAEAPGNPPEADATFEALYTRLEAVTAALEVGNLSLEQSVALYEEGMLIAQRCQGWTEGLREHLPGAAHGATA